MQEELDRANIDIHASSSTCDKCISLESKIVNHNKVICNHEKDKNGLENVLSSQKYVNDKIGLGIFKLKKYNQIKRLSLSNLAMFITCSI